MVAPRLRSFRSEDEDACYEICLRTADDGGDASRLHHDPRIVGEVWVGPYLRLFPEFALVVEDEDGVGGYVVGAADTDRFDERAEREWYPPLRRRYPRGHFPAGTRDAALVDLIHAPPRTPREIVETHPAHLHIDLLPRLQRRGFGRKLMGAFLARVRAAGAGTVHLGCSPSNANAIAFYRHLGFEDLLAGAVWGRSTDFAGSAPESPFGA